MSKRYIEIKGMKIPAEIVQILIERIKAMPPNIKLAVLGEFLDKKAVVKAVTGNTEIGQEILSTEAEYYFDLFR